MGYNLALPVLGENGWYEVFYDEFDRDILDQAIPVTYPDGETRFENIWATSPEGLRRGNEDGNKMHDHYWCSDMVTLKDGKVEVLSYETTNHLCSRGVCPAAARFTSGIETRKGSEQLFSQAFGHYECRVKLPDANGMWSAFWLQSNSMGKIANMGLDGTEIDIYESAFRNRKDSVMGHALLWNGYAEHGKVADYIGPLEQNLYDGEYHTFALKWTPLYYVFYIDGEAHWASDAGGVSRVAEFVRLTCEMDGGDEYGPYGERIGAFPSNERPIFYIDYVKVWQNSNFAQYEIYDNRFPANIDAVGF